MRIEAKIEGLDEFYKLLDPITLYRAQKRTTTEIGNGFRKTVVKDVRKRYNVKAKYLKKKMSARLLKKADGYEWRMLVKGKPLSLSQFGAKQTKKGVSVEVIKGERKLIKSGFLKKGQVFVRENKERFPIKALKTLSAPQMFRDDIVDKALDDARRKYPIRFKHNVDYYMGKIK